MNGELVDWADAKIHVGAHGLHYGSGVFEGIRCYETEAGPAVFRLTDHLERLHRSAELLHMEIPYSVEELRRGDPRADRRQRAPGLLHPPDRLLRLRRARRPPGDEPGRRRPHELAAGAPTSARTRSRRASARRSPPGSGSGRTRSRTSSKATGIYLNSMLAMIEASAPATTRRSCSPTTATSPTARARTSSSSRTRSSITPDLSASILPGITRETVMEIAQDLGYAVQERGMIRSDLYLADEVFMCGTAAEVTPIRSVDDHEIGAPGPVTKAIQDAFFDVVRGRRRALVALARVRRRRRRRHRGLDASRSRSPRPGSAGGRRSSCSRRCARGGSRSGR